MSEGGTPSDARRKPQENWLYRETYGTGKLLKTLWLTAIFLHLPVRAEALQAALGTAGLHSLMKGFALHPFCDGGRGEHIDKPQFEILSE